MLLFSQVAVLLLLALIAAVFLVMLRHGNKNPESRFWDDDSGTFPHFPRKEGKTLVAPPPPILIVEQLNPKTMKRVKEFPVCEIPKEGVPISRPNARNNDDGILLSTATGKVADTVSARHAVIALDADGLFIQDCESTNGTFDESHQKVDEINITDGMILYLGKQPLRFSIPKDHNDDDTDAHVTRFYEGNIPNAPITVVRRKKR